MTPQKKVNLSFSLHPEAIKISKTIFYYNFTPSLKRKTALCNWISCVPKQGCW